ncbi:MAG TPA: CsgG/HfaB family protein [Syntrophorhabdaceae bacterium]|nr:CsgG/HfaB family protein [Syntrophorhabdaceae bacterium]
MKYFRIFFLLILSLAIVYGCVSPGKESFDTAQSLIKSNRLEEAISMLEDAVAKEPDNQEYKNELNKLKASVSKRYIDNAKALADKRPTTIDNLNSAFSEAEKALKLNPGNESYESMLRGIKSGIDALTKRADELYTTASKLISTNEWAQAVKKLREIGEFYPNYLDLPIKLAKTERDGVNYYLDMAQQAEKQEDYGAALKMLEQAREIKPDNPDIIGRLKNAQDKHRPAYYLSRAEEYAKQGDWDNVIVFIKKAAVLGPRGDAIARITKLQQEAAANFINKAKDDLLRKRLNSAYLNIQNAHDLVPNPSKDKNIGDITLILVENVTPKLDSYEQSGLLGNAYIWYDRLFKLTKRRDFMNKRQALEEKIRQRVVKKIAVKDFDPPTNNKDAGRLITDNLLTYLTKNSTSDVKILARDVLGDILKEIELGQAGLADLESAKKAGKLKGTDIFILGNVLQFNIEKNKDEGQRTINAVVGKKRLPNDEYRIWRQTHPDPTPEQIKYAPPQYIEEDETRLVSYKVATYRHTATVTVSYRIIDVEEGEVKITDTLKETETVEGNYQEGVEFANIPYIPLKMPSDSELFERVINKTVAKLGQAVLGRFQNLQISYSEQAKKLLSSNEYESAIEKFVDAIHVEKLKRISTPITKESWEGINKALKDM